ncbi:MAG: hypothetical protein ACI9DF_000275 [Verrucomicrobiales bacterium]
MDIEIVVDLADDFWIGIGDLEGIPDEIVIVELCAEFRLKKQSLLQLILSVTEM